MKLKIVIAKRISLGGYSGDDVARRLRISGRGVSDCRERGKKILLCRETSLSDITG